MKKNKNKKLFFVSLAVLLLCIFSVFLWKQKHTSKVPNNTTIVSTISENGVNYSPPTQQEKDEADQNKDRIIQQTESEKNNSSTGIKDVKPVITSIYQTSNEVIVPAYVSGIYEDGGKCTLEAKKDDATLTTTSASFADATTTSCSPLKINLDAFKAKGTWSFSVTYLSSAAKGVSVSQTYTVK